MFCCLGSILRLVLIRHSLYVGVVEKSPPAPLTGEQYRKMEPKYPEGGHCQSVLSLQGVFNILPLFLIIQWRRQWDLTWSATHDVVTTCWDWTVTLDTTMKWAKKLISGKVSTSCWDQTCDPWHQVLSA